MSEPNNQAEKVYRVPENPKLRAISTAFSYDIPQLISEAEEEILDSWNQCEQEAQDQETAPKFKLGFGVTLDLDKDTMETKLTFGTKHTKTISRAIPDPNQPSLPLSEGAEEKERTTQAAVDFVKAIKRGKRKTQFPREEAE